MIVVTNRPTGEVVSHQLSPSKKRLLDAGGDPIASTPAEYAQNIQREERKWQAVIKTLGLVVN